MRNRTRGSFASVLSIIVVGITFSVWGLVGCSSGQITDPTRPAGGETSVPLPSATPSATPSPAVQADEDPSPTPSASTPPAVQSDTDVGLLLDPPAADGSISGKYRYVHIEDHVPVHFTVTSDGKASFRLEGAPESESLIVTVTEAGEANMTWAGVTMDGLGALTKEERAALMDYFQVSDLLSGLSFIPLDIACQGEDKIDDRQLAALLFPLQMHFKYVISERAGTANYLAERSACNYAPSEDDLVSEPLIIQMTSAMPVPVVFGYFPFDEAGAVPPAPAEQESEAPSLGPAPAMLDEYGACGAMCRGACGPDCEPNNCTFTSELQCEQYENGENTGLVIRILTYDCGLHEGCIEHDACYDQCNETYGCDTWAAAFCRHAQFQGTTQIFDTGYCDQRATEKYGIHNTGAWVRGYGPQPMREVFEYIDPAYGKRLHEEKCPVGKAADGEPGPTVAASATVEGPRWVRDEQPIINASGEPLEYYGGGATPGYFTEERFQGTWNIYVLSETSISLDDRWVDRDWEAYNVSIRSTFDAPPAVLVPGDYWYSMVRFSDSGTVVEGNPGARFQYGTDREHRGIIKPSEPMSYFPWAAGFLGEDYKRWSLEVPPAQPGETFQIVAFWWNCPVCDVTWTYRAEQGE